jgi:flagellar hook-basal body complex protein FliE
MNPIPPIGPASRATGIQTNFQNFDAKPKSGPSLFEGFLAQTNLDQKNSDQAIKDLVEGKAESVQQVVMAVAKAEMSFQLFMEIRNNLIDSYNELMRMQF